MAEHNNTCPLAAVDRRLEDLHRQWHQAEQAYFEPEEFRISIQTAIQTSRTVTFILQNNKHKIPEFDSWYQEWQDRLSADPLMRWMKNARNKIEKQGDLDAKSFIRAEIVGSYFDEGPKIEVPAELTDAPAQLVKNIPHNLLGDHLRTFGTLRIQRRWVENTLPDYELLDAVAIAYGKISELVSDAHRQMGLSTPTVIDACVLNTASNSYAAGRMPCMIAHADARSLNISLKDGLSFEVSSKSVPIDIASASKSAERYGIDPKQTITNSSDYERTVADLFATARIMMIKDKSHVSLFFLLKDGKPCGIIQIDPEDQGEKYMLIRNVAQQVARKDADGLILIGETWGAPINSENPYMRAADSPERQEALSAILVRKIGEPIHLSANIRRYDDEVSLDNTDQSSSGSHFLFAPVYEVWGKPMPDLWPSSTAD